VTDDHADGSTLAAACLDALRSRGQTLATAESLTAGLACATIASVPGASDCLRGGLAAYASDVKTSILAVDQTIVDSHGVVSAQCALEMAGRAQDLFDADWAVATTGVAGPTEQEGRPVGTVYVAVAGPEADAVRGLSLTGDRDAIRTGAVRAVLQLLLDAVVRAGPVSGEKSPR
jgi:nicotinamide-nucleotide amidase